MSEIKILRMTSGEEIIAKATEKMEGGWTLKKPAILIPHGQGQLALAPWMPYADVKEMNIPQEHIVFVVEPVEDLQNEYNQAFGSGLVVPNKNVAAPVLKLSD